ncbi:MAG: homoserine O-acetyltransferase [Verrucomicrobia bacterium]|nr:MAG: homoserine O-acetyltransferase [Verrucomicrobiota bacterium]
MTGDQTVSRARSDPLESSDSVRSAKPLRDAQFARLEQPLDLERGGRIEEVTVAYETYGNLNEARDNAILICHAISGDSHVAKHNDRDDPGWWDIVVGPGKVIDTTRLFVICPNLLGGCRGTTGPGSNNPATGRPYGRDFPTITVGDMVTVQRQLLEQLGIPQLLAVVGGSLGGHQALVWAARYPEAVRGVIALATSPRLTTQAIAFDVVGRNAILRDPHFQGGQYYGKAQGPDVGLALARMIGHITYLSPEAMTEKFEADRLQPRDVAVEFEKQFSVGSYLGHQGAKFVERFDANSYLTLSIAMDLFDLGSNGRELAAAFARTRSRWLVLSFSSDWLFPPEQSRHIVNALLANSAPVSYCNVQSHCGHDAFLLPDELSSYGGMMRAFLDNLAATSRGAGSMEDGPHGTTSIFRQHRLDYDRIVELIPSGASVLDLGCGSGGLLARLMHRARSADGLVRGSSLAEATETGGRGRPPSDIGGQGCPPSVSRLVGVELDESNIFTCISRGLDVIHADLNKGLGAFATGEFEFVVLSQTLQTVQDVELVVMEMLRVGQKGIVSIPNFAYEPLRRMLYEHGRAPKSGGVLRYEWYNTPNARFFSIADFEDFCRQKNIIVHRRIALDTEAAVEISENPNLKADLAIFVLSLAKGLYEI